MQLMVAIKTIVRSGIRTHAHRSGLRPERSALDRSAILTTGYELKSIAIPSSILLRSTCYAKQLVGVPTQCLSDQLNKSFLHNLI